MFATMPMPIATYSHVWALAASRAAPTKSPDRLYFSWNPRKFDFLEVTEQLSGPDSAANADDEGVNERGSPY